MLEINKQESLEEFIKEYLQDVFFTNISERSKAENLIRLSAKWQQDQSYNEADMKQFAFECVAKFVSNDDNKLEIKLVDVIVDRLDNHFGQFKNKQ